MTLAESLLENWRQATASRIRFVADIWWDPSCAELVEALQHHDPVSTHRALVALSEARHARHFSLAETIDDVDALRNALPPARLVVGCSLARIGVAARP